VLLVLRNGRFGAMRTLGTVIAYKNGRFPNKRNGDNEVHGGIHMTIAVLPGRSRTLGLGVQFLGHDALVNVGELTVFEVLMVMVLIVVVMVMARVKHHGAVVVLHQSLDGRHHDLPAVLVHNGGLDNLARHLDRYTTFHQIRVVVVLLVRLYVINRRRHFVCYCL